MRAQLLRARSCSCIGDAHVWAAKFAAAMKCDAPPPLRCVCVVVVVVWVGDACVCVLRV